MLTQRWMPWRWLTVLLMLLPLLSASFTVTRAVAATGEVETIFQVPGQRLISDVTFSPDGALLATSSVEGSIWLRDADQPSAARTVLRDVEPVLIPPGAEPGVGPYEPRLPIAFSADGTLLAAGGSQTVRFWNVTRPEVGPVVLLGHDDWIESVAFSPDGTLLASGSLDGTVRLWRVQDGDAEPIVLELGPAVGAVAFSPDGETLATGDADGYVRLWSLAKLEAQPVVLPRQAEDMFALAFSPDGALLASGGHGSAGGGGISTIKLWNPSRPADDPVLVETTGGRAGGDLAFSPDGRTLATASDGWMPALVLWSVADLRPTPLRLPSAWMAMALAFSPDGTTLVGGMSDGTLAFWDLAQPAAAPVIADAPDVSTVTLDSTGSRLASAPMSGPTQVWDLAGSGTAVTMPSSGAAIVNRLAFSVDGRTLVGGGFYPVTLQIWDLEQPEQAPRILTGSESSRLGVPEDVVSLAVSPDGQLIAMGNAEGKVRLWNPDRPIDQSVVLEGNTNAVTSLAFSPDGTRLASGAIDQRVLIWQVSSHSEPPVELPQDSPVFALAFSPDGATLATVDQAGVVRVWGITRPEVGPTVLASEVDRVESLAFSPDGRRVAAGGSSGVRVWDLGAPTAPPASYEVTASSGIPAVVFSPDGGSLIFAGRSGTVWRVELAPLAT